MTEDEIRKEEIHTVLKNLKRKIDSLVTVLNSLKRRYETAAKEYKRLDLKIFMETKGVTVIKSKKGRKKREEEPPKAPDVEKMSNEERSELLQRLLKVQEKCLQKHSGKLSC